MAPKLYVMHASPAVRSVLMCAKALDLELELVPLNLVEKEQLKDDYLKKNPQHTVPVLEDDDGFIVCDSHAINAYLVSKYGKDDSLYPVNDYKKRSIIDHRLHFDTGILFGRAGQITVPLIYQNMQPNQEKFEALREAFQFLEQILVNNKTSYVAGNNLSIADFSITSSITTFDLFIPYTDFPNITAYIRRIEKLPFYEANKAGLAMFNALFGSLLQKPKPSVVCVPCCR